MQKLIKITDDHYVVVDDSEIQEGDWYYDLSLKQIFSKSNPEIKKIDWQKKITHSTRPFGGSATAISLHEVKELIEVDVEKKAELYVWGGVYLTEQEKQQTEIAYITGYNQALEDNKDKKYTEEGIANAITFGWNLSHYHRHNTEEKLLKMQKDYIQSLQSKTSWDVQINFDGKLELIK